MTLLGEKREVSQRRGFFSWLWKDTVFQMEEEKQELWAQETTFADGQICGEEIEQYGKTYHDVRKNSAVLC